MQLFYDNNILRWIIKTYSISSRLVNIAIIKKNETVTTLSIDDKGQSDSKVTIATNLSICLFF